VNTLLRLGLELPPFLSWADSAATPLDRTVEVSGALARAGFQTLWLADDDASDAVTAHGAVAAVTASLGLGVIATIGVGRHPTMVARDLTTLDVLSSGRAALIYRTRPDNQADISGSLRQVIEAVTISRQMLENGTATVNGRFYDVPGAVNRPTPVAESGLPIVVQLGSWAWSEELEELCGLVDGLCCGGEADNVALLCRRVGGSCPVIWSGPMPFPSSPLARQVIEAGAAGVICQFDVAPRPEEIAQLGQELVPLVAGVSW
jgi:Luciferase-like monooxygenase